MGLSRTSTGKGASSCQRIKKENTDLTVLLAGNPNVGKSTLFNRLTGMNQHTGNWTGKTVATAVGICRSNEESITLVDLPGCYSLSARSAEEAVARDALAFESYDTVTVVCDAGCLQRNLFLVLQILELAPHVNLCVNLEDEARKKGVHINAARLSRLLGIPVSVMSARKGKQALRLLSRLREPQTVEYSIPYPASIENYIAKVSDLLCKLPLTPKQTRELALRLLDEERDFARRLAQHYGVHDTMLQVGEALADELIRTAYGTSRIAVADAMAEAIASEAERIASETVCLTSTRASSRDRRIDRFLIGRITAFPVMLLLLFVVLWLTIQGANAPSAILGNAFSELEAAVRQLLVTWRVDAFLVGMICEGMIRVVGWVISVMLPPMAIFFPLFTLLEDIGYLPRVAFNLDRCFKGCRACGKQALTMCMGLGCNAAGVVGCRIIDSPRERLLAILTNAFMPCNGRFPMLIAIISIFFASSVTLSSLILVALITLAILLTLLICRLLSLTLLRGVPSSFLLELPPYRKPQIGQILVRSVFDRTLFVLGRAIAVAAPTGLLLWLLANIGEAGANPITAFTSFLDPIGRFLGLDGVILFAFIFGLPANEIVIPIILMCYLSDGSLSSYTSLASLKQTLISNGWTSLTAVNMLLFTVFHWPCSTTILTIRKETGSLPKTLLAVLLPTTVGILLCLCTKGLFVLLA